jgi:hypothetical protein
MTDRGRVALVAADGRAVVLPQTPDRITRSRATGAPASLMFVAELDDRLGSGTGTADVVEALWGLEPELTRLEWGARRFATTAASITVTETAFDADLRPIAATVEVSLELAASPAPNATVVISGTRWTAVDDLGLAGPDDEVFRLHVEDDGTLVVQFGDGHHGRRPPPGDVHVRARYRTGGRRGR